MKKIILLYFLMLSGLYSADFINPNNFKGTEKEKQQVIEYIKENVKTTYEAIGMGDPSTLRMMESEQLKNFKSLINAENKQLLNAVIKQYCSMGMCDYSTISMMYTQQLADSKKEITW